MKQFLLAFALIAVPVAAFSAFQMYHVASPARMAQGLGDLSSFKAIVVDAQSIAATGDMQATQKRMTDFETAWDNAQSTLRPLNPDAWGAIDDAHDAALHAVRSGSVDPNSVSETLAALLAVLDNPDQTASGISATGVVTVAGVAVTDATGRALPCETMLDTLRTEIAAASISETDKPKLDDALAKGTERCNADDDRRADEFFAQGLSLLRQ